VFLLLSCNELLLGKLSKNSLAQFELMGCSSETRPKGHLLE
jgi:hypothetical protein